MARTRANRARPIRGRTPPAGARRRRRVRRANGRNNSPRSAASVLRVPAGREKAVVGLGAFVAVVEATGGRLDGKISEVRQFVVGRQAREKPNAVMERAAKRFGRADLESLSQVLAAFGSVHRLIILATLLEGPATYRSLQHRTSLKAGPLYHHINQLRLTNLVGPKSRDTYILTRAGRNVLLLVLALGPLLKGARSRPMPGV
jgi:hypothetical protein